MNEEKGNLSSADAEQRRWAIIEASRNADAASTPMLLELLHTDTYENRRHIVRALGNIGGVQCEQRLLELLGSEEGLILGDIARSLGKLRCTQSLTRLRQLASHETDWVQSSARWALKNMDAEAQPSGGGYACLTIAYLVVCLISGCATTGSIPRFSIADPFLSEVAVICECRDVGLLDMVDYLNKVFADSTGKTNYVIVSALTPQQEAESLPITLQTTAPLSRILPQLAKQALVRLELRDEQVVLHPDLPARRAYAKKHAAELTESSSVLTHALETLRDARNITLWDPEERKQSPPAISKDQVIAIVSWIKSQPLAYDESDSRARVEGTVCACLPWVIEFGEPKQTIAIHGHDLIINNRISFRSRRGLDLDSFRAHIQEVGVSQEKDHPIAN